MSHRSLHTRRKHVFVMLPEREHAELKAAAARLQTPMSAIARRAIEAYLVGMLTYYYVQTTEGTLIPPATEVGFSDFKVARAVAVRHSGEVVMRSWTPVAEEVKA